MAFLKEKTIPVGEQELTIRQLSGLDRFDFMDFCSDQTVPEQLEAPKEDANQEEKEAFLVKASKVAKQWDRLNFIMCARLVAFGSHFDIPDIEKRHQHIMASMSVEQIKYVHDEVAKLSGMELPAPEEDAKETETELDDKEPVDPKA
ncbi:phage minor tail protein domain-containing protein [Vibrio sp. FJH11]